MTSDEEQQLRGKILGEVLAQVSPVRQSLGSVMPRIASEVRRFKAGAISVPELFYWQKTFARNFLAFADALCYALSQAVVTYGDQLGAGLSRRKKKDLDRPTLSLWRRLHLAFPLFPTLFGSSFELTVNADDERGFQILIDSRDKFTHPKQPEDLRPAGLLAATLPAVEWFFMEWNALLVSCAKSIGPVQELTHERKFRFLEQEVAEFEERLRALDQAEGDSSIKRLGKIIFGLTDDTRRSLALIREQMSAHRQMGSATEPGVALRNAFLTIFSDIEGSVFALAHWLHLYCDNYPCPSRGLLTGKDEQVRERIAGVLEAFSQEFGRAEMIDRSRPEWESFAAARRIRDRMTHPKGPGDWSPRQEDAEIAMAIHSWWHLQVRDCMVLDREKVARLLP